MGGRDFDYVTRAAYNNLAVAGPPMSFFSRPAVPLTNLATPSAADLAARSKPAPASQSLLKPGMSSSDYIQTLEQHKQSLDAVKALAHGMPERSSVLWACQSSQKVADKLNPQELAATSAAQAWVKNPSPTTQAAAADAASKTDFRGPGGWAAQAAAWSKSPAPAGTATAPVRVTSTPAAPSLTASAVSGSVLLAAGLVNGPPMSAPQKPNLQAQPITAPSVTAPTTSQPDPPPVDQSKLAKPLQPFIDMGKDIAGGKSSWA